VASLDLFTWNLGHSLDAHNLFVQHLAARQAEKEAPFVACVQEVPGESDIGRARRVHSKSLCQRNIGVVRIPNGTNLAEGIALIYDTRLQLDATPARVDEDGEFVAAMFRWPGSNTQIAIFGVHATSRVTIPEAADRCGSRALLRHAINELQWSVGHTVILGDFNSEPTSNEMTSWHCFYAPGQGALDVKHSTRRRYSHPRLAVVPAGVDGGHTYFYSSSSHSGGLRLDFIVTDLGTADTARSSVMTHLAGSALRDTTTGLPLRDTTTGKPSFSDHLPVSGTIQIKE
jgi:endonuclease/exonuclease/phosphatase family metal-dependent hydrolase